MGVRVVVLGIPGVGKTTVVDKLHSKVAGSRLESFGSVMLEDGIRLKWIKHRDELRKLPVVRQRRLQKLTATRLSKVKDRVLIIDTHLFIRTKEGFWPGLPFEVVRALKPTHLVLVEARTGEIQARRAADSSRYRDVVGTQDLESELALARSFLTVASTLTGAPMLIVSNGDGRADEVAARLAEVLKEAA